MKNPFARHSKFRWPIVADISAILLAIVIFTAAALPNVLNASAYFDEGYSAYLAKFDIFTMSNYTALDVHPPLYYALLHVWQYFTGDSVAALRMLSIVLAWVAIVFAFLVVRRGFSRQAAWTGVLLMSLSPLFIRYGASMRMYTMALAIGLAATYVLMIAVANKKKRWPWITYGILVAAGMWTNYFMALVWLSHLAWLIYEFRDNKTIMSAWRWAIVGALVLYLPWLPWLIFRYGEIQVSGFWIKPISVDTLVSTVTMSFVFRNAAATVSWLAAGVLGLIAFLIIAGRNAYKTMDKSRHQSFRLIATMASLPVLFLALISLPPLRSSYVYRYVLFASVTASLLIAIIITYAKFKRRDAAKRAVLYALTFVVFITGAIQATIIGNRNLDTDSQNKLGQVMRDTQQYSHGIPVVVRSPYSYYAAALYETSQDPVYFIYSDSLKNIGSTKPLYDHPQMGVRNFDTFSKVWIVGEDRGSVVPPHTGKWNVVDHYVEYDDVNHKPAAFATLYERIK
jgi:uncharacterized membrane protein